VWSLPSLPAKGSSTLPVRCITQCDGPKSVRRCKCDSAGHGRVSGKIAWAAMARPTFQCAEASDTLGPRQRVDAAVAHHLRKAWQPRDAVRAHAVAVSLRSEARREGSTFGFEAKVQEHAFEGVAELVERNTDHGFIRTQSGSQPA